MIHRHRFEYSISAAAAKSDTGSLPINGEIRQVWWVPTAQDTGPAPIGTITVFLRPNGVTDTGRMAIVSNNASVALGNDFMATADTGVNDPTLAAGETLMARITPVATDTGSVTGSLFVYVKS